MYQPGEYIMYGSTGVCRVEQIAALDASSDGEVYYKLSPVFDSETIFVPVDSNAFMRPILTREQAEDLIDRIPEIAGNVCDCHSVKLLNENYRACLHTHEIEDIVRLMKSVYAKNQRSLKAGRQPGQIDQLYLKRAEKLLHGELAVALGLEFDEVPAYIEQRLDALAKAL